MTVYVDDFKQRARVGRISGVWSHLFSDTCDEELHELAAKIGLDRSWFQKEGHPVQTHRHYDVTNSKRLEAIAAGAEAISWREAGRLHALAREGAKGAT